MRIPVQILLSATSVLLTTGAGCAAVGGSLATSTGPRRMGAWSEAGHQAAHVGETVEFSFILTKPFVKHPIHPAGLAEYAILRLDGQPVEMELDDSGKFSASFRMPADWEGREIRVKAAAYRQYGQRDRMVMGGQLHESQRPEDEPDKAIASDSLTMLVYQSSVQFRLTQGSEEFDWNAAHIVVRKNDGTAATVPKSGLGGLGFQVEGPDDSGEFVVRYEPTCAQVNQTRLTEAELTVYDRAGRPHRQRTEFMTP